MKKVFALLLILTLSGCSNSCSLFENQCVPVEEITKYIELGYKQETAEKIALLSDETKGSYFSEYNSDFEQIINCENFRERFLNEYDKNDIDIDTYLFLKENNYDVNSKFLSLYKDPFFILKNLDLYYKYEKEFRNVRLLVEYVNAKAYKKWYEEYEESDLTKGAFIIASKIYHLGEYVPTDLVNVENGYHLSKAPQLKKIAWQAFKAMADAAKEEKVKFYIISAYRSYESQKIIYNNYLKTDPQEVVDTYSSRYGFSDHQIGLSVDVRSKKDETFDDFINTKAYAWLKENAYKYGFIQRYPKGKEKITGYMNEPWHYRYVGKDAAKIIHDNNITFEEYYAYYVE